MYDISSQFHRLGLTKYQSGALSVILINPGCTATAVSEKATIPLTKVYSVIFSLEQIGYVNSNFERPKKYFSIDPKEITNSLIQKQKNTLLLMRKEARLALKILEINK